jgi:hypothetical protein
MHCLSGKKTQPLKNADKRLQELQFTVLRQPILSYEAAIIRDDPTQESALSSHGASLDAAATVLNEYTRLLSVSSSAAERFSFVSQFSFALDLAQYLLVDFAAILASAPPESTSATPNPSNTSSKQSKSPAPALQTAVPVVNGGEESALLPKTGEDKEPSLPLKQLRAAFPDLRKAFEAHCLRALRDAAHLTESNEPRMEASAAPVAPAADGGPEVPAIPELDVPTIETIISFVESNRHLLEQAKQQGIETRAEVVAARTAIQRFRAYDEALSAKAKAEKAAASTKKPVAPAKRTGTATNN